MLNTDHSISVSHKCWAFGGQILNHKSFERSTWLLNSSQIDEHFLWRHWTNWISLEKSEWILENQCCNKAFCCCLFMIKRSVNNICLSHTCSCTTGKYTVLVKDMQQAGICNKSWLIFETVNSSDLLYKGYKMKMKHHTGTKSRSEKSDRLACCCSNLKVEYDIL